jgi:hypothetical protein
VNTRASKKKEEKTKLGLNNKNEMDSLSNKKTVKKDKNIENVSKENNKDINENKKINLLNKKNVLHNNDMNKSNTIIINNINNNKNREVNVNKVDCIHINNNHFENNNNLVNYDYLNENFIINNNLKQKNNNILINNLNNNNLSQININNNFNTDYLANATLQLNSLFSFKPNDLIMTLENIIFCIKRIIAFFLNVKENISNNMNMLDFLDLVEKLKLLKNNYEEICINMIDSINKLKEILGSYRAINGENTNNYILNDILESFKKKANEIQKLNLFYINSFLEDCPKIYQMIINK